MHVGLTPWDFSDPGASALAEQAAFAEAQGYASFWLPENHFNPNAIPDPLMLLSGVAAATRRIRLGTTSYLLTLRHPLLAAEQVAVLDQLSAGRVILGVGRGYAPDMLKAFNVVPGEKREVFETTLAIMRRAWEGEAVEVGEGAAVTVSPLPSQRPHPPIWVAAFGPKALAQAGRLGLPYLASPMESMAVLESNYAAHRAAGAQHVTCIPVMRSVFVTRGARETTAVCELLASIPRPRAGAGAGADSAVNDWAVVGEASFVRERICEYRERLGMTHLIVARLRAGGMDRNRVRESVIELPGVLA